MSNKDNDPFNLYPNFDPQGEGDKGDNLGSNQGGGGLPGYPSPSKEEIEVIVSSLLRKEDNSITLGTLLCGDPNCTIHKEDNRKVVAKFIAEVFSQCTDIPTFLDAFKAWKNMIHLYNRTTALASSFTFGVAIGWFLAHPEMIPTPEDVVEGQAEKVNSYLKSLEMMEKKGEIEEKGDI